MDSRMSFSGHIDVTSEKLWQCWGLREDCQASSGILILLGPLNKQVVCGGLFITCTSVKLSVCWENSIED
jgi:hypothetical protein